MTKPTADERVEMIDVLYRFAAGQDRKERELFLSAFSENAVLDFSQPAERLGLQVTPFEGRQAIADAVLGSTAGLDTTHTVSNLRIEAFDGGRASLYALVEAQHLPREDHSRHLLLKNHYRVDLERDGDGWCASRMVIENVWKVGDASVLFPA